MAVFNHITIIGIGLIGGSLAKAVKKKHLCKKIVGFFRNEKKLKMALKKKLVDEGHLNLKDSVNKSDLIVLALPINQILKFMSQIKKLRNNKAIIIDVGSTKLQVVTAADKLNLNFVGTHPLAGSEKKGTDFSSANLFDNSNVIITPTKKTNKKSIKKVQLFWKKLNTNTITLPAKQHDKILSLTSHLPHLVSFCLINSIPEKFLKFGASGLKDSTRIALSDAQIWSDILLSNKKEVLSSIKSLESQLKNAKRSIKSNKKKQLIRFINVAKDKRGRI